MWNQTPLPRVIPNSVSIAYVCVPKLACYQHYLCSTLPQSHTQVCSNDMPVCREKSQKKHTKNGSRWKKVF